MKDWNLSPAPESASHINLNKRYEHFINGQFQQPSSKKYFQTISPSTNEVLAEVALANEKDVDSAMKSASAAHKKWSALSGAER